MTTKEALERVSAECDIAREALKRAADVAKEHGINFPSPVKQHFIAPIPKEIKARYEELECKDILTEEEEKEFVQLEGDFDYGGIYYRPYLFNEEGWNNDYTGWWSPSTC